MAKFIPTKPFGTVMFDKCQDCGKPYGTKRNLIGMIKPKFSRYPYGLCCWNKHRHDKALITWIGGGVGALKTT